MSRTEESYNRRNLLNVKELKIIFLFGFILRHELFRSFTLRLQQLLALNNLQRVKTLNGIGLHLPRHDIADNGQILRLHGKR